MPSPAKDWFLDDQKQRPGRNEMDSLGMILLHPTALIGLVAAAAPVVIYLLLRRRKKEVQWGAGYLLRLALASRKKSSLWRQYVVLAVRSLILALAALLIAQPFKPGRNPSTDTPALPDRAVHRVV